MPLQTVRETNDIKKTSIYRMTRLLLTAISALFAAANTTAQTDSVRQMKDKTLKEVQVVTVRPGTVKGRGLMNESFINSSELTKAACCNLGESFTTNPSVDVSYSDAATGAKQVKLLGLSGTYVQMMTENIPNFRGAAAPYSLGYVPGPWMQSIQVSKGAASVKNGYESITGQINIEYLKPQLTDHVNANLYGNTMSKIEANADGAIHLTDKWSLGLLLHYEDKLKNSDHNHDGFMDEPDVKQYNGQLRWAYFSPDYIFQAGVRAISEERGGGQTDGHAALMTGSEPYTIGIKTHRYEAFAKNAVILNHEHNTNIALILDGTLHEQEARYGVKRYDVNQKNLYASLLFETDFTKRHNLSTGLSLNHDYYREALSIGSAAPTERSTETTSGAFAQYTLNLNDRLIAMAGLRLDYSDMFNKTFMTPRAHVKWSPNDILSLRASVGKGYRTVHALAENNYLLGSGRTLSVDNLRQEEAWNYGVSATLNIPVAGRNLQVNAEYYYTDFLHQAVIDYDCDPTQIRIANLQGTSYSHTFQIDATYPVLKRLTVTAAYRLNDVKTTFGGQLRRKPLQGKYKGLLTASYKTPLALWQFDATLQLNGGGRLPAYYDGGTLVDSHNYKAFGQLSAQITRWFRHFSVYVGGENLTGFRQKNPVINAADPWSDSFDTTLAWGPVSGAMGYVGIRFNLEKLK